MPGKRIAAHLAAVVATVLLGAPAPAAALTINAPASKNLGTVPTGGTAISAQLGPVTVTDSGLVAPSFVATVSSTVFTTGGKTAGETIPKTSIRYWSGPATLSTGLAGSSAPGQLTAANAQDLSVSRTAFTARGLLLTISVTWNPTLVIDIPSTAVAGVYTGTITHSAA